MLLDRQLQLDLLNRISECYPFVWDDYLRQPDSEEYFKIAVNLNYLKGHGLISDDSTVIRHSSTGNGGGTLLIMKPKITEKGLDFLKDDGGLTAILGVLTVRFEADTIRTILQLKVDQSDLDPERKQSMIDSLRELPAESIKHLTMKLLDEGLENLPSAIVLIGTYLGMS